jgi:hypothetical protein
MNDCAEQGNCCGTPSTSMQKYIGTKIIFAEPMNEGEFRLEKGFTDVSKELLKTECYMEGYKVVYSDGYVSWSPKAAFEEAYHKTDGMAFGLAVEAMKKGFKVARTGWNGKGMFVVYQKGYPQGNPCNKQTAAAWGMNEGDLFICQPYLQIKNVDGSHSMWVPSINDTLAEDWMIIY